MVSLIRRNASPGMQLLTLQGPTCQELFLSAVRGPGEAPQAIFQRVSRALQESDAQIVSQEVFGLPCREGRRLLEDALGDVAWPLTWVEETEPGDPAGTQVWAVSGPRVQVIRLDEKIVGSFVEDDSARYCRLGGLIPGDPSLPKWEQAREVFEKMEAALIAVGMEFRNVLRTWLYLDDLLSWYDNLNRVRTEFFTKRAVSSGVVPASTGVAGRNAAGAALTAGLLALQPKSGAVRVAEVPSPLQCPASQYKSSFSRAVELALPGHRRLLLSGTASIGPDGETAHAGDMEAQVSLTMRVAGAILESRGMDWQDVTRAIAYFKNARDLPFFERWRAAEGVADMPVVLVHCDICRDDLLFEIEMDALRVKA